MGIRYENLKPAARKKIWQHHVGKVEMMAVAENENDKGKQNVKTFTDDDFNELAKKNMNGRQVGFIVFGDRLSLANVSRRSRIPSRLASPSRYLRRPHSAWTTLSVCWRSLRLSRTICVAVRAIAMLCSTTPKVRNSGCGHLSVLAADYEMSN
jgi:hypothetical protein